MRGHNCAAHKHPMLVPLEVHHIWPLGYHGPDILTNKVTICANAHSDIHYLLEAMLRQHPYNLSEYGPAVRALARRGYNAVMGYSERLGT
jgi:5-methylcytosine-specific restriction endonuclease McrA